jgi:uncharacterized metal-binding protein
MDHSSHSSSGYLGDCAKFQAELMLNRTYAQKTRAEAVAAYCKAFMYACFGLTSAAVLVAAARVVQVASSLAVSP